MLAIDIGASGGKAVRGQFVDGKFSYEEVRRFKNGIIDINGRKHWDFENLLQEVKSCLQAASDVDKVGIDTWGVDYGYLDSSGRLLAPPYAYRDSRTQKIADKVHEMISFDKLYSITGIQFMPINTIYQIADDLMSHPETVDKADKLLMMPELLAHYLTGESVSEYTNASTTGLLDAIKRSWSDEILDAIGFPREKLPDVVMPGQFKRNLSRQILDETGCSAELVTVATHDTASAIAAIPAQGDNWAYVSSGTWSLVGTILYEPVLNDAARMANFTNEGGVDGSIRFLKNISGLWLFEELRRMWAQEHMNTDYEYLIDQAKKASGFESVIDTNHESFIAPDDMRIAIQDYCCLSNQREPSTTGEFTRCVFLSLASAYADTINQLAEITGKKIERIHIVGGGSRNVYLCDLTEEKCRVPVVAGPSEASSIGNLLIQALLGGGI